MRTYSTSYTKARFLALLIQTMHIVSANAVGKDDTINEIGYRSNKGLISRRRSARISGGQPLFDHASVIRHTNASTCLEVRSDTELLVHGLH